MTVSFKRAPGIVLAISSIILFLFAPPQSPAQDSEKCVTCHEKMTPGIVGQWNNSLHSEAGIGCLDCHAADPSEVDAFKHGGTTIAIIVSPKDCSQCHETEFNQQKGSHHAKAGQILGSLDNLLGEVVGGEPAVNAGCRQCHGSIVEVDKNGRPTGKCHLGPDHPQIEVWNESKHGIMYHANREQLNLDADEWRAGVEYFVGPTCASCHMSAAGSQGMTHDVGERISWTLRPPISVKLNMVVYEDDSKEDITGDNPELPAVGEKHKGKSGDKKSVKATLTWDERRNKMQAVCRQCHNLSFIKGAYKQFDEVVHLYNDKFAIPATKIMKALKEAGKISSANFDDPIEWTYWELWHHEGRRARHGASMQGPDYTWWHGMYEVAKHFYEKFIPEMREAAGEELAQKLLDEYVYPHPGHLWYRDGMSKEALEKIQEFYMDRYDQ
jgi:hypothetical protein